MFRRIQIGSAHFSRRPTAARGRRRSVQRPASGIAVEPTVRDAPGPAGLYGPARSSAEPLGEKGRPRARPEDRSRKVNCPILGSSPRTSLGVQLLDLARRRRLRVRPDLGIECPRRVVQQLLLPRIDLPPDLVPGAGGVAPNSSLSPARATARAQSA